MNIQPGQALPPNWHQSQGHPGIPSGVPNGFALHKVMPGERMPEGFGARSAPGGPSKASIQPGQLFKHPGYNASPPRPAQRSTTNPIRPGMMAPPPGPAYRQVQHAGGMQSPSLQGSGPYPSMQQAQGSNSTLPSHMPQLRSVTAPVHHSTQGPQRYELHDPVSSHSVRPSASDGNRTYQGRNTASPPLPFPPDPRSTPPPLDSRSTRRVDSLPDSHQASHSGRSDSVSSSVVGANGVGVSMNNGGAGRNPLAELMESEKLFVERTGLVVRVSKSLSMSRSDALKIRGCRGLLLAGLVTIYLQLRWTRCSVPSKAFTSAVVVSLR
jgi:hypothetical protein